MAFPRSKNMNRIHRSAHVSWVHLQAEQIREMYFLAEMVEIRESRWASGVGSGGLVVLSRRFHSPRRKA